MRYEIGTKLVCLKDIYDSFTKGKVYEIIFVTVSVWVNPLAIILVDDHEATHQIEQLLGNFISLKALRQKKLKRILE